MRAQKAMGRVSPMRAWTHFEKFSLVARENFGIILGPEIKAQKC